MAYARRLCATVASTTFGRNTRSLQPSPQSGRLPSAVVPVSGTFLTFYRYRLKTCWPTPNGAPSVGAPARETPKRRMDKIQRAPMDLLTRLTKEPLPFAIFLGIKIVSAVPDKIVAEMTVRDDLCTRPAVLHGGGLHAFSCPLSRPVRTSNTRGGGRSASI